MEFTPASQKLIVPERRVIIPDIGLTTEQLQYKPFRYPWAYDGWLMQQRLHWLPEEVPLADDVRDWNRVLNNRERNLVTQIFRFFTQCYDDHTEILTENGWVRFSQLSETAKVAQVTDDDRIEFVLPVSRFSKYHEGDMYAFGGNGVDLLVTGNHKMVFKDQNFWQRKLAETVRDRELKYGGEILDETGSSTGISVLTSSNGSDGDIRVKTVSGFRGMVYCVSVPSGRIAVRRNGVAVVCGNSDIDVNGAYMKHYAQYFKPTEVLMMLSAFSNIETVHIAAYSTLLDTIGMPESEYGAFTKYKEMKAKHDFTQNFNMDNPYEVAKFIAVFAAFTEGLQLFSSFAILMNFPRFNKLKGMGQIVSWSVRDESLHCSYMIRLFRAFVRECYEIWTPKLRKEIQEICRTIVEHEDEFINLAFELGGVDGLEPDQVKAYIRFIANRRLSELGIEPIFDVMKNPLPFMVDVMNAVEHTNFFENRSTEYSKAATTGSWSDVTF